MHDQHHIPTQLPADVLNLAEQKQAILSAIIANSDDTIISKTLQGIITTWNLAAERMFGYAEAEVIGQHISLIIPHERLEEEVYIMGEITQGRRVSHFETVRMHRDGSLVSISLSVSPVIDATGKIIGASKIARDVTEQLAVQMENARLYEQVKLLNEKKDEFIALASHELKTPLTSIQGYLQILTKSITDDRSKTFLHKVNQNVKRVSNMISEMLDISKIEAGKLQLNMQIFDLRELVRDVIDMISSNDEKIRINFVAPDLTIDIHADAHRIEQVITNLLTNAIRYSPGAYEINVFLIPENNIVKIGVQDNGIGIPEDKLKHVFSKFYRVNDSSAHISGLGIGLYLTQEIVLRHNGKISVESELGKGSTFWVTLPV